MSTKRRKFTELRKGADFVGIGEKYGISPLIARIMRNREVVGEEQIQSYLYGKLENLNDPYLLRDGTKAAEIIKENIKKGAHIRVIGDYDIDGVMSSYILTKALTKLGANVSTQIPHRINDGYGLNRNLIEEAHADQVDCIITCDNGISASEEIALAKQYNMTVVVTDHHQVTQGIPNADAVVNPHQPGCEYPFKDICGATVAWKVMHIVYDLFNRPAGEINEFIENVAFATVGDIMPLKNENRILVRAGLRAIQNTNNPGMAALISQCGLNDKTIKAYHFGFVLGPCINATGRLDTASRALKLFLTEDVAEATMIASELVSLNESRKEITVEGVDKAVELYETGGYENDPVIVLYLKEVHESIAGIIAGRIRERYYKPTFILTDGEDCVKGSARSIEGYSLSEEMQKISEYFIKYGGHPMAAGLSIEEARIEEFRRTINENCPLSVEEEVEVVQLDACPELELLTVDTVGQLDILEPYGNENRSPLFGASKLSVRRISLIGKNKNCLKLLVASNNGLCMDAIMFNDVDQYLESLKEKYGETQLKRAMDGLPNEIVSSFVYVPKINEYGGPHVQLEIKYYM